jgi:hypothetical protein
MYTAQVMQLAAKERIPVGEPPPQRRGGLGRRRPGARKLASGGISCRSTSHRASRRCNSLNALGMRPEVRRNRGGPLFHRWYEHGIGRYGRPDPLLGAGEIHKWVPLAATTFRKQPGSVAATALSDLTFATAAALLAPTYGYAQQTPVTLVDPTGLLTCQGIWIKHSSHRAFLLWPPLLWNGCFCWWRCESCDEAPDLQPVDRSDMSRTTGTMMNTGKGARFGDTCLCPQPGPQTGCFECEPPLVPQMRAPGTASCADGRIVVNSPGGPAC